MTPTRLPDGETAFPFAIPTSTSVYSSGMTLRDWFAGLAMQGFLVNPTVDTDSSDERLAAWAYAIADAMLSKR